MNTNSIVFIFILFSIIIFRKKMLTFEEKKTNKTTTKNTWAIFHEIISNLENKLREK